ncbi:hypothetical protein ACHAPJ_010937 [Fusarium lateritium]
MTSNKNTIYVVTGGNRGIGFGLVKALLARPSTTVVATVRNGKARFDLETSAANISKGSDSALRIIQLDFSTALAPDQIHDAFDLDHIDVLINNAAVTFPSYPALQIPIDDLRTAFEVNTIGPLTVVQGLWPLLEKSPAPKVVNVSSTIGCISFQEVVAGAYGPSKTALNWLTRALHFQNENLVAFALHPGFVGTQMGKFAATEWGFDHSLLETTEGSAKRMLEIIDSATRETASGKFITYKGQELPW